MSTFNIRYGGQIESVSEGFNFNGNYGTDRLHIKVNSTSTLKLGLTTNTNAQEYCHFTVRVGGVTGYIGRVSTLSRTGIHRTFEPIDRNGSTIVSLTSEFSQTTESKSDTVTYPDEHWPEFTYKTTTSYSTRITSYDTTDIRDGGGMGITSYSNKMYDVGDTIEGYQSNSRTIITITKESTSAATTQTYYSFSVLAYRDSYRSEYLTMSRGIPAAGAKKTITITSSRILRVSNEYDGYNYRGTDYNAITAARNRYTKANTDLVTYDEWVTNKSTTSYTRRYVSTTTSNTTYANTSIGVTKTVGSDNNPYSYPDSVVSFDESYYARTTTVRNTYISRYTINASVVTTSNTTMFSRRTRGGYNSYGNPGAPQEIQTLYRTAEIYYYSYLYDRYHSETINPQYLSEYHTTFETISASTTYTLHNMNI